MFVLISNFEQILGKLCNKPPNVLDEVQSKCHLKKNIIVFVIFEAEQMDLSEPPLSSIMKHALCLQISVVPRKPPNVLSRHKNEVEYLNRKATR